MLTYLLLISGFILLILGAHWLVNGAVSLARKYQVSELAIGLTLVAFGTSAPELVVNIISSIEHYNDVTVGNIIGSNLFNIMLILGLAGMVYPIRVQVKTVWKEIPVSMLAAALVWVVANDNYLVGKNPTISRIDGLILLLFFLAFLYYIYGSLKVEKQEVHADFKIYTGWLTGVMIIAGLAFLVLGSKLVVESSVKIAREIGISEKLIGLTIVSAGTSLPELFTSVVAAAKKRSDIAIGNIVGSNIFNIFLILGVSSVINPIRFNPLFNADIVVLLVATIFLFLAMFSGRRHKLDRWESVLLFLGYLFYMAFLISKG